jgi:hypothetical protein
MAYSIGQFILSAASYSENMKIKASCMSLGAGRICFLLLNSQSPLNGYLFKFSAINGEEPGQIIRLDNGVATDITTYKSGRANSAQLTGAHGVQASYYFAQKQFQITVDGKLIGTATDSTYAINGPFGYAAEVIAGEILDLDINGHEEILTVNPSLPDVSGLTATITNKSDVQLKWTALSTLPAGFDAYEIRVGSSWAAGTILARVKTASFLITDPAPGSNTYFVGVKDLAGFYDATPPSVSITFPQPGDVTSLTATVTKKNDIQLKWTAPTSLPTGFAHYEIRSYASNIGWAGATLLATTKQPQYLVTDPPTGTTVYYWVGVKDLAGNYDASPLGVSGTMSAGFSLDTVQDGTTYTRTPQLVSSEAIENASFDLGSGSTVPGWQLWSATTMSLAAAGSPLTGNCIQITTTSQNAGICPVRGMSVTPGVAYKISGYVKSDGTSGPALMLGFLNASGGWLGNAYAWSGAGLPASWSLVSGSAVAPAGSVTAYAYLVNGQSSGAGTCKFKHITISRVRSTDDEIQAGSSTGRASDVASVYQSSLTAGTGAGTYSNSVSYTAIAGQNLLVHATVGSISGLSTGAIMGISLYRYNGSTYTPVGSSAFAHSADSSGKAGAVSIIGKDAPGPGTFTYLAQCIASTGTGAVNAITISVGELMC